MPEQPSQQRNYYCSVCGMVRPSDRAPWCRHNDPEFAIAAMLMVPLPDWHPLAKELSS